MRLRPLIALFLLLAPALATAQARRETYPRLAQLPVYDVRRYGAKAGDGVDDRTSIKNAIAAASAAGGGVVELPPGEFTVDPNGDTDFIDLASNVIVRGHGRKTVIKVKNNAGNYERIFGTSGAAVSNVTIADLVIDQNATGNTTCNVQLASGQRQFAITLSAGSTNVTIRNVRFEPCTGVNTIVCGGTGSSNITVADCYFRWDQAPTTVTPGIDNTAVYLEAGSCIVARNHFYSDSYADCPGGAIEIHGPKAQVYGNLVDGYGIGTWVVSTANSVDQQNETDASVIGNIYTRVHGGVGLLCTTTASNAAPILKNVQVTDNLINIKQDGANHDAKEAFGIDVRNVSGTVQYVAIRGNTIIFEPDTRTTSTRWGVALTNFVGAGIRLGETHGCTDTVVENNTITRAPWTGLWIGSNSSSRAFTRVRVARNKLVDCGWNENGTFKSLAEISGVWTDSRIEDNEAVDTATGGTPNGSNGWRVYVTSAATRTFFRRNSIAMGGSGTLTAAWLTTTGLLSSPSEGTTDVTFSSLSSGVYTPDPNASETIKFDALSGTLNVQAPAVSLKGHRLRFIMPQDGTGGRGMNFNAVFKKNWTPDTTASRTNVITFECDGTNWNQVATATGVQ